MWRPCSLATAVVGKLERAARMDRSEEVGLLEILRHPGCLELKPSMIHEGLSDAIMMS